MVMVLVILLGMLMVDTTASELGEAKDATMA
jgi:hypothetical protein